MLNLCFSFSCSVLLLLTLVGCGSKPVSQKPVPKPLADRAVVAPALSPEQDAMFQEAIQALQSNRIEMAQQGFLALLEVHPNLAGASVNLGLIARQLGREDEAIMHFERALDSNPSNVDALVLLALVDLDKGDFWDAEAKLQKSVRIRPESYMAHFNLGVLYELYLQEPEKAVMHYQRYVDLKQGDDIDTVARWIKLLELR
ncbi:MAG: hypothetical protein C9356_15415 [Oleiphilus sp.]|nr:MAG: hypothetical protein C9356_15415 [Oleiphilus sp.]